MPSVGAAAAALDPSRATPPRANPCSQPRGHSPAPAPLKPRNLARRLPNRRTLAPAEPGLARLARPFAAIPSLQGLRSNTPPCGLPAATGWPRSSLTARSWQRRRRRSRETGLVLHSPPGSDRSCPTKLLPVSSFGLGSGDRRRWPHSCPVSILVRAFFLVLSSLSRNHRIVPRPHDTYEVVLVRWSFPRC